MTGARSHSGRGFPLHRLCGQWRVSVQKHCVMAVKCPLSIRAHWEPGIGVYKKAKGQAGGVSSRWTKHVQSRPKLCKYNALMARVPLS